MTECLFKSEARNSVYAGYRLLPQILFPPLSRGLACSKGLLCPLSADESVSGEHWLSLEGGRREKLGLHAGSHLAGQHTLEKAPSPYPPCQARG